MKTGRIVLLLFILFSIAILFKPLIENDLGWHVKYGEYIFTTKTVPSTNLFSYTFTNYKWADSYWLIQLILFSLYKISPIFLSLGLSIAITLTVVLTSKSINKNSYIFLALGSLLVIVLSFFWVSIRPLGASVIFILILMHVLLYKKSLLKFLPIIFCLWANMHADFVFGLGILGVFSLFEVIKAKSIKVLFKYLVIGACSFAATLVNPYGITLWLTMLKETHTYQFNNIIEWMPYVYSEPRIFDAFIMATTSILMLIPVKRLLKSDNSWLGILQIITFLLAMRSMYFFRIFALISFFPAMEYWNDYLSKTSSIVKNRLSNLHYVWGTLGFVSFLLMLIFIKQFFVVASYYYNTNKFCTLTNYPCQSLEYIKSHQMQGNMLNAYNWGGFLIYTLPKYKTFVDGRMTSWRDSGTSIFEDHNKLMNHPYENEELLKLYLAEYNIHWAVIYPDVKLASYLQDNMKWIPAVKNDKEILLIDPN